MKHKLVRIAIGVTEAFNALSAIGGGIALLASTYKDSILIEAGGRAQFPLEWLRNTPFSWMAEHGSHYFQNRHILRREKEHVHV
jgi:hypothetical protein